MNHFIEIRSLNLKPGTREAILALIESYSLVVFELGVFLMGVGVLL